MHEENILKDCLIIFKKLLVVQHVRFLRNKRPKNLNFSFSQTLRLKNHVLTGSELNCF